MLKRRTADGTLTTSIRQKPDLSELLPHWTDLCGRCLEDNVYYSPHYALPLMATVAAGKDIKFVTVWDEARLVALLPVVQQAYAIPGLAAGGRSWTTDFTFSCMPLIDRSCAADAAQGLLNGLAALKAGEWVIPQIYTNGSSCLALVDALELRHAPWVTRGSFQRASMTVGRSFEEQMAAHVDPKRRRELARNRRRLEEFGEVRHEVHMSGQGLDRAVKAFLELEAGGWKGKRGTALANRPDSLNFALRVFGAGGAAAQCRADLLLLDGKPIAAGMTVFSGTTGFTVKGAYDEFYAKYSAGLLLEVEVIRSFLTERWAARLDAATNGEHVIDRLWPDRMPVADLVFSLSPYAASTRLAALNWMQDGLSRAKSTLKGVLRR